MGGTHECVENRTRLVPLSSCNYVHIYVHYCTRKTEIAFFFYPPRGGHNVEIEINRNGNSTLMTNRRSVIRLDRIELRVAAKLVRANQLRNK